MNRIGMFPLSKYKASKVVLLCQHFQALISPSILVGVYFLNFLPTFISSKLKLLQVSLSVEMSSGISNVRPTVAHTDLIVHHPQGRNRILTFVIIQIIRQIVCLCYTVHRDGTLQGVMTSPWVTTFCTSTLLVMPAGVFTATLLRESQS